MTEHDLRKIAERLPLSESTRRRNQAGGEICPAKPKPPARKALVSIAPREAQSGQRVKVVFRVYAVRPCDWDNYWTKGLQDCLVGAGLLCGDDWRVLRGEVISEKVNSRAEERTEIEITTPNHSQL